MSVTDDLKARTVSNVPDDWTDLDRRAGGTPPARRARIAAVHGRTRLRLAADLDEACAREAAGGADGFRGGIVVPSRSTLKSLLNVDVAAGVAGRDVSAVAADVEAALGQVEFPLEHHATVLGGFEEDAAARSRAAVPGGGLPRPDLVAWLQRDQPALPALPLWTGGEPP